MFDAWRRDCKQITIQGYKLDSLNGVIGKAQEFYFDDQYWTIRYLVADSGNWLTGRRVLLSPYAPISRQGEYRRRQIRGHYRSPTQERGNYYAK